jgi:pimeloyl-ACP methyl ester carboxylesterase
MGDSSIPSSYDFTAEACADDIKAILEFLKINETYVFAHDKGSGVAAALTTKYRSVVKRLGLSEYALPGFGYEAAQVPTALTNIYSNWQLDFFAVPDAAQYFIQGREREMLSWYFFHSSYSGTAAVPSEILTSYADSISKPGFLRSGLQLFSNQVVAQDAAFFNSSLGENRLKQPVLVLGGEASFSPTSLGKELFSPVAENLEVDVVPKAGHWIGTAVLSWVYKHG